MPDEAAIARSGHASSTVNVMTGTLAVGGLPVEFAGTPETHFTAKDQGC